MSWDYWRGMVDAFATAQLLPNKYKGNAELIQDDSGH
jgi:hypothetical protein